MFDRNAVRQMIETSGLKQKIVAERADITERQFSLILSGKRKCDIDEYVRICTALNVPVTTFIIENHAIHETV
ncbi:MAG: helix-turn-helix transcriptional regulator [Lachnospiraceae bacterium]|nr:helix-turn-helix transcriptional regulator [Lachnospiraceae bacterium]MBD5506007.1 helix-turn-helix transcriptional regulator [Lachnospiraceae bacterium]